MSSFSRWSLMAVFASASVLLSACRSEPFCLNCVDGMPVPDGFNNNGDAIQGGGDVVADVPSLPDVPNRDIPIPDGCMVGAEEVCNGFDDNCDGRIDEGFDLQTNARNCGMCGVQCMPAHAIPVCVMGMCQIAPNGCDTNFYDLDRDPANGCEYACTPVPGAMNDTTCDRRDDDCDGQVDEDVDLCGDIRNCGSCGRSCLLANATPRCVRNDGMMMGACTGANTECQVASCEPNFYDIDGMAANGCEYSCTRTGPEVCDGRDNNCDGQIDEGNPGSGMACGSMVGACRQGRTQCQMGRTVCMGEVVASPELCDGIDNDCNGMVDDNLIADMRIGLNCGSGVGDCRPGRNTCVAGAPVCTGGVGPQPEVCDGRDNNCDGMIDNGVPSMGACGSMVGACRQGALQCMAGSFRCVGATGPTVERCNRIDDDCNGVVDNGFDLQNDPNNCGACGTVCAPAANATVACRTGSCRLIACAAGFYNLDNNPANGCEYACQFRGNSEVCNGVDDNCDGRIDEGVVAPAGFCRQVGLCMGATASCMGARGFVCNYPAGVQVDPMTGQPVAAETLCNGRDDNCNGAIDETFANLGLACNNGGVGICGAVGRFVCSMNQLSTTCNAPPVGMPAAEICDGVDNDCDGSVDEPRSMPGANASFVQTPWVNFTGNIWAMQYEASRPDSSAMAQGVSSARACSRPGVLPWTNLTGPQAEAACGAIGARLCTAAEWQQGCRSTGSACDWSYNAACTTYAGSTCNGVDNDIDMVTPGVQNGLLVAGALANCRSNWGGAGTLLDMSGNAKEFTAAAGGFYNLRGGSYNNLAFGTQCNFAFTQADANFRFVNAGFRCCYTGAAGTTP